MKANYTILYDEACPLCQWYTGLFLKYGLLNEKGRMAYQQLNTVDYPMVDLDKAKDKIACIEQTTGKVVYGIDSLLTILGQRFPLIQKIGSWKIIHFLLSVLYNFISYNRKIIANSKKNTVECACDPSKNYPYRIAFVLLISLATWSMVQTFITGYLAEFLIEKPVNDGILLIAQLAFQLFAFQLLRQKNSYDYLAHLAFVSFLGALLLGVATIGLGMLHYYEFDTSLLAPVAYGAVILFMFLEHKKRLERNNWSAWLSVTWIVFRMSIYFLVFQS